MPGANWKAIYGLGMALVVLAHAGQAQAGGIPSYAKVVDVGLLSNQTYSEYPRIDNNGNISPWVSSTVGNYTFGRVFDPDVQGKPLYNYLYQNGSSTNLLPQSFRDPYALVQDVNSSGVVIGYQFGAKYSNFIYYASSSQIGQLQPLQGVLQLPTPYAINSSNQIVGEQDSKAIFYASPTSEPVELSALLPTASGWKFLNATGINDRGEIVGYGINPSGVASDFKLIPSAVPEPGTLAMFLGAGLVVAGRWIAVRRHRKSY